MERTRLDAALHHAQGHKRNAAHKLGSGPATPTLTRKRKELGMAAGSGDAEEATSPPTAAARRGASEGVLQHYPVVHQGPQRDIVDVVETVIDGQPVTEG